MTTSAETMGENKYVSLTTFRRSGDGVATPVWVVPRNGKLYVSTEATSGKAKRLRHTSRVTLAPCDARGKVGGEAVAATAVILPPERTDEVLKMIKTRYGLFAQAIGARDTVSGLVDRLRGRSSDEPRQVGLEITLAD